MYFNKQFKRVVSMAFSVMVASISLGSLPAISAPHGELQDPGVLPNTAQPKSEAQDDILLLMPNSDSSKDDTQKAIDECKGTVVGSMGSGELQVLIVKTEKGKAAQTEKKLEKSKKFGVIQRNHRYRPSWVPNDPEFPNQWHMSTIRAHNSWGSMISSPAVYAGGSSVGIAVFDSGCNSAITELNGYYKCAKGYDAMDPKVIKNSKKDQYGQDSDLYNNGAYTDSFGHGTEVATTAAAHGNNGHIGSGVAPGAHIYPVRITGSDGLGYDIAIVGGILQLMKMHQDWAYNLSGQKEKITQENDTKYERYFKQEISPIIATKIINISYDIMPDFKDNKLLQKYFKKWHDTYGGLVFVSSGNDNVSLDAPRYNYVNVVSAINKDMKRAWFSNYGNCVTLTAPGTDIICTDQKGKKVSVDGTSFAAPQAAAVAAIVWAANFKLSNTRVEEILKRTAIKPKSGAVTKSYGEGLINAEAARNAAKGG